MQSTFEEPEGCGGILKVHLFIVTEAGNSRCLREASCEVQRAPVDFHLIVSRKE